MNGVWVDLVLWLFSLLSYSSPHYYYSFSTVRVYVSFSLSILEEEDIEHKYKNVNDDERGSSLPMSSDRHTKETQQL